MADLFAQVPRYLAAVLLVASVLLGRTRYPRWTAVAHLGVLLLAVEPLAHFWPVPLGGALADGFSNLALALSS